MEMVLITLAGNLASLDQTPLKTLAALKANIDVTKRNKALPVFKLQYEDKTTYIMNSAGKIRLTYTTCAGYMVDPVDQFAPCRVCKIGSHPLNRCMLWKIYSKQMIKPRLCEYPHCPDQNTHVTRFCNTLNWRCHRCFFRGHQADQGLCDQVEENKAVFLQWASLGWLTRHHTDQRSSASGYFPVLTITAARDLEMNGGHRRLYELPTNQALKVIKDADAKHDYMVGSEPARTEVTVIESMRFHAESRLQNLDPRPDQKRQPSDSDRHSSRGQSKKPRC